MPFIKRETQQHAVSSGLAEPPAAIVGHIAGFPRKRASTPCGPIRTTKSSRVRLLLGIPAMLPQPWLGNTCIPFRCATVLFEETGASQRWPAIVQNCMMMKKVGF